MLNARLNRAPLTRPARLLAALALAIITIPLAGFGQSFVTFSGSVIDPAGRIIPGVTLVLSDAERESKWEVRTDRAGHFEFAGVPAGTYALEVQFIGFRPLRENVALTGRALQKTIELQVGTLQETITVVSGPGDRAIGSSNTAPRSARAARPPAEYDPCSASPVGGCLKPPTKILDVRPVYPAHLGDAKVGGVVRLTALIDVDGTVTKVEPVEGAEPVDPALTDAAIAAVRQWEFTPTQLGGVPIEVEMTVAVNFRIR
jgi:TonB family protein